MCAIPVQTDGRGDGAAGVVRQILTRWQNTRVFDRARVLLGVASGRRGPQQRGYFRSTRVPRIFCELSVLRNVGSRRSINSKYDDSAGVEAF